MRRSIALAIGLLSAVTTSVAAPAEGQTVQRVSRPPPLEVERPSCELFRGTGAGNSDALVELRLCPQPEGGALEGVLQWSSTESGWSQRAVVGRWEAERFVGHETRFLENRPAPGWRFCLIDTYSLFREGERLSGTYVSEACEDHGRFDLERVDAAPPARPPQPPRRERAERERGGACSVRGAGVAHGPSAIIVVLVAGLLRGRRRFG